MVTAAEYRQFALALEGAEEVPHFDKPSFRVNNRIFATFWEHQNKAMVKLTPREQSVFCSYKSGVFYPVPGSWGQKGATMVELSKVRKDVFKDALKCAYNGLLKAKKTQVKK